MSTFSVGIVKSLIMSTNLETFCQNLVFSFRGSGVIRGMEVFAREHPGALRLLHKLTDDGLETPDIVSLTLSDSSALAFSAQKIIRTVTPTSTISTPIEYQGMLLGTVRLTFSSEDDLQMVSDEEALIVATATSAFLETELKSLRRRSKPAKQLGESLSPRQLEVFQRMSKGEVYSAIARELHMSESLVRLEASRIFRFLGVRNRSEAIFEGRHLLTTPPPRELVG